MSAEQENIDVKRINAELVEALEALVREIKYRRIATNVKKDFSLMNYLVQADKALTKAKGGQA